MDWPLKLKISPLNRSQFRAVTAKAKAFYTHGSYCYSQQYRVDPQKQTGRKCFYAYPFGEKWTLDPY